MKDKMDNITEYLKRKHAKISRDYENTPEEQRINCTDLAMECALRLSKRGWNPEIRRFSDDNVGDDGVLHSKKLVPVMFGDRIKWPFHDVCYHDLMIYDVFLGEPCFVTDYTRAMFGKEKIPFVTMINENQIGSAIQRYIRKDNAR